MVSLQTADAGRGQEPGHIQGADRVAFTGPAGLSPALAAAPHPSESLPCQHDSLHTPEGWRPDMQAFMQLL